MSKWREFTIHLKDRYFVEAVGFDSKNTIHVIEYSAYESQQKRIEQLEAEIAELKKANANCISLSLHESRMKDAEAENQKLRAANEVLREAILFYADGYTMDEEMADDDCEQDKEKPWRFTSGVRARAALESADKIMNETKQGE